MHSGGTSDGTSVGTSDESGVSRKGYCYCSLLNNSIIII